MLYRKKIYPYYPYIVNQYIRERKKEKLPPPDPELIERLEKKMRKTDKKKNTKQKEVDRLR